MYQISTIIIKLYLILYNYYGLFLNYFFSKTGKLVSVYHVTDKMKNITHNYYLNYSTDLYQNGIYFIKIYSSNCTDHLLFKGSIGQISHYVSNLKILESTIPVRKKLVLLDSKEEAIDFDLEILDRYYALSKEISGSVTNLGQILSALKINCQSIVIINLRPYSRIILNPSETDIADLYI